VSELLLLSNSTAPGMGFLEHATEAIQAVLGDRSSLLFVPFASSDPDTYTSIMRQALAGATILSEVGGFRNRSFWKFSINAEETLSAIAAIAPIVSGRNCKPFWRSATILAISNNCGACA